MFLMIENEGLAPVEGFTILGLSTARGQESQIGQFGSGNKHAINVLLRNKLDPIIFIGKDELQFGTSDGLMKDKAYKQVVANFKGETHKLGFCLEFGELDWNSVDMALREFVSNAIDASSVEKMSVKMVEAIEPREGWTRIFVDGVDNVKKFYNGLKDKFLHFDKKNKEEFLDKEIPGNPRIYRKGVFVRETRSFDRKPAMFDYNFGDELKIDESRNLDDYNVIAQVCKKILNSEYAIRRIFQAMKENKDLFETNLKQMYTHYLRLKMDTVKKIWEGIFGNVLLCSSPQLAILAAKKGKAVFVPGGNWYELLEHCGVQTFDETLNKVESHGNEILPCNGASVRTLKKAWKIFEKTHMTCGKPFPKMKLFSQTMQGGALTHGYVENDTIYINLQCVNELSTFIEELIHYTTGAGDFTYDFQHAATTLVARIASPQRR